MMFALKSHVRPWFMWSLPLMFFAFQFILRLWPSLLMTEIMGQFHIDATAFGFLSAMYYLGYAGMQIPLAISLDYYGSRVVVSLCMLVCGLATLVFTYTDSWQLALLSRFFIGVGSAAGFLGTSKAVALWFGKKQYSFMIGLSFSFGLLGALYGGKPISFLIESYSWPWVATSLAVGALVLSLLMVVFFKKPSNTKADQEQPFQLKDLKYMFKSPALISLAIANLFMVGSLEGFADVWGVNYLMTAYQYSKSEAAGAISFIFVGMLFGGPLLAWLSRRWGPYPIIVACGLGMTVLFLSLLTGCSALNGTGLCVVFFGIGLLCCYQVIVFEAGSYLVPASLLSVTVAFLNCINMFGGSFFHSIIGCLMDFFWTGELVNSGKLYTVESYLYALSVIPLFSLMGGIIVYGISRRQPHKAFDKPHHDPEVSVL